MEIDKNTTLQILGSLMKNPLLLAEVDKYSLTPQDFSSRFERYIFASIANLYSNGAEKISVVDIDNYLADHEGAYKVFNSNNGIDYLNDAEDFAILSNFNYYYTRLKKFNALKDLKLQGYDISRIYPEKEFDDDKEKKLEKFEQMSVGDIFTFFKTSLASVENKYETKSNTNTIKAEEGIKDLLKELKISPEVGANLQGDIFNTIVRGARKGKFYVMSAPSGGSKSRTMVGNACYIAYPIRYNQETGQWIQLGSCKKVVYICTEQQHDEIQTMVLAYLSGINEEKILYGTYSEEEEDILKKAVKVMEMYSGNLIITQVPNPNIQQVKVLIRKFCLVEEVEYVFYDYIFSSPNLLSEFRDLRVREDVALLMFSTALKDLAAELNIFMMTATQISGDLEESKGIRDYKYIRGAKSIVDKADIGMIVARVSENEQRALSALTQRTAYPPNQVCDIYKVRRGRFTNVRIWSYIDLGTCRKTDLFLTDASFKEIQDFRPIQFMFDSNKVKEYDDLLALLNTGEVTAAKVENSFIEASKEISVSPPQVETEVKTGKEASLFDDLL